MTFDEWFDSKGIPISSDVIGLMRIAWDAATKIEREACADACEREHVGEDGGELHLSVGAVERA